jgi:hypothetical protein
MVLEIGAMDLGAWVVSAQKEVTLHGKMNPLTQWEISIQIKLVVKYSVIIATIKNVKNALEMSILDFMNVNPNAIQYVKNAMHHLATFLD